MLNKIKKIVKPILATKAVRSLRRNFGSRWHKIMSSTYLLSIPLSILTPIAFMREQRAVRAGKGKYYKSILQLDSSTMSGLRRNIHRLEKALIMRPRRKIFAKDYILETVEWYKLVVQKNKEICYDSNELNWANNVLSEYFSAVSHEGVVQEAKELFDSIKYDPKQQNLKPFIRKRPDSLPTFKEFLELAEYRRSVRWFKKKSVPRKIIDNALLAARQSPTACNRSPYEFRVFDNPELVKKVAHTPFGASGYADNIPAIAVVVGRFDSYFSARDRHAIYTDSSLAVMSFLLGLETQGVSSCIIHWPDFEPLEIKMQKLLGLKFYERPIMLIAMGYEDNTAMVPRSSKKELDTIRSYNKASNDQQK